MAKTAAIMESFAGRHEKVKKDLKSWPRPDFQPSFAFYRKI